MENLTLNTKILYKLFAISTEIRYLWQKITMKKQEDITISQWIENLQSHGRHAFSLTYLASELSSYSDIAIKRALSRLTIKGKIVSIYKGYYLIISPQYNSKGILPPTLFLDGLMKHLQRPYYLALLNAAAFYGAAHQQPQEFSVVTNFPVLRPTQRKGIKISYISKKEIISALLETKKTETGYIKISNPALTACDLIQYEKRIGGINRASTVLNELAETIEPKMFNDELINYVSTTSLQRLGFILESVLGYDKLADYLLETLQNKNILFFQTPLKTSASIVGFPINERWKVVVNTKIEIDE